MFYMFEVQIPVDAYPVFGLKKRSFLFVIDNEGTWNQVPFLFLGFKQRAKEAPRIQLESVPLLFIVFRLCCIPQAVFAGALLLFSGRLPVWCGIGRRDAHIQAEAAVADREPV